MTKQPYDKYGSDNPYSSGRRGVGSVWATGQSQARHQRGDRYVASSVDHPGKMLPQIARHAIGVYSRPGEVVLDPMCGIGTTLVEAVRAGRHAIGVEVEPKWMATASANLYLARRDGHDVATTLLTGDSRALADLLPAELHGSVSLVVTSPPYGASVHGQVSARAGQGVTKTANRYSADRSNLAYQSLSMLVDGIEAILAACAVVLRPGGHVVVTTRPWRDRGRLVDFPGLVTAAGARAGLVPVERCVALLAAWRNPVLVPRASFFALDYARKSTAAGTTTALIVHEDVLVFTAPINGGDTVPDLTLPPIEPSSIDTPGG